MPDRLGLLELPVPADVIVWPPDERTRAPGDPALEIVGSFAATILQHDVGAAWERLSPGKPDILGGVEPGRNGSTAARRVFFDDPRLGYFEPSDLPALFVYRAGSGPFSRYTADQYRRKKAIGIAWLGPRTTEDQQRRERDPFFNAVEATLHRALVFARHRAWVLASDLADDDGLVAAPVPTSLSPITLTSADFDGALAAAPLKTGRPLQLKTSVAAGAYNITDPIVATGKLDSGVSFTDYLYLTNPNGGETVVGLWSFREPTEIMIPAQLLTMGAITLGFYASPDAKEGSLVQRVAGFVEFKARAVEVKPIPVAQPNADPIQYRAVECLVDVTEELAIDLAEHGETYDPNAAPGLDAYFAQGNFNTIENPFNSFSL
jgi:hypothetical protein